jgi:Replication-relaxation
MARDEQPRGRADAITHETSRAATPHADAFATVANAPVVRDTVRDTSKGNAGGVANLDELPLRDRDALRLLTQLRFLSYRQLREVSYPEAHASVTRRRVSQLLRAGAISVWEAPGRRGGHTRYAIPTAAATRAAVAALSREVEATPYAPLIRLMLPQTTKRALRLEPGVAAPNWFAHQVEVNALVLRYREAVPLLWMSSWDCPFPSKLASFDLPQPDFVLIEETPTGPCLVFGEHDRGSEPVERFVARKVLLYAALSAFPEACTHHFGLPAFTVRVTVTDPVHRAPMRRLMDLLRATARAAGPEAAGIFRFTLAGWLHAYPNEPIWFAPHDEPAHASVRWQEHTARHANDDK